MTRLLITLTAVLVVLVGLYHWYAPAPATPAQTVRPSATTAPVVETVRAEERRRHAEAFGRFSSYAYSVVLGKLYRSEIRLEEAVEKVYLYSVTNYPDYLIDVSAKYPGGTMREKVARALIDELRSQLAQTNEEDEVRAEVEMRLDAQLQEFCRILLYAAPGSSAAPADVRRLPAG